MSDDAQRWRITIRGNGLGRIELRGYADLAYRDLVQLSEVVKPFGVVIASPADEGYDPFGGQS